MLRINSKIKFIAAYNRGEKKPVTFNRCFRRNEKSLYDTQSYYKVLNVLFFIFDHSGIKQYLIQRLSNNDIKTINYYTKPYKSRYLL